MGVMMQARCSCGYESEGLLIGGGMMDFDRVCWLPAACATCREIVNVDVMKPRLRCPRCRRKPTLCVNPRTSTAGYDALESAQLWSLPDGTPIVIGDDERFECPRCATHRLRFEFVGVFD